jgi:hypothetical protein
MEIQPEEIFSSDESPLTRFYNTFQSEYTKQDYDRKLKKVMCEFLANILVGDPNLVNNEINSPTKSVKITSFKFPTADYHIRVNQFVKRAKNDHDWAENLIITIIQKLKDRTKLDQTNPNYIQPDSVKNYYYPIQKLLEMNKVNLAFKLIRKSLPQQENLDDSRGWSKPEIKKMLQHADATGRVLILLAASSGIRAGSFDFRWNHLIPVYQIEDRYLWEEEDITESVELQTNIVCGMIRIYADSREEYFAFITPECWEAIQEYRQSWIMEAGRQPQPNDPFLKKAGPSVKPIKIEGIRARLVRILIDSGLRQPLVEGKRRHKVPPFNGFRRFFNKANKQALSKNSTLAQLIIKENMMGHTGLIRLDKNYFKTHLAELIEEYLSAVSNLTISEELKQKFEIKNLEEKNSELANNAQENQRLKDELDILRLKVERMALSMEKSS